MPELPKTPKEKPVYETPVVVDLNTIQRGEGGTTVDCHNGSAPSGACLTGAGDD